MEFFHRQFDQRKPAHKRWVVFLNLKLMIAVVAIGALNLGLFVAMLIRDIKGDALGSFIGKCHIFSVVVTILVILLPAIGINRAFRMLESKLPDEL
jgi:hypothetical protein